jgi:hypothetical protein
MIVKSNFAKLFGASAITIAPFIFIAPSKADDKALVAHEMVHYKEQLKWLVIPWWIAYLVSRTFRKNAEIRAYKVQIALGGISVQQAAYWMSTIYMLGISQQEAEELLK